MYDRKPRKKFYNIDMSDNLENKESLPFDQYAQAVQKKLTAVVRTVTDLKSEAEEFRLQYPIVAQFGDPDSLTVLNIPPPINPEMKKLIGGERHRKIIELIEKLIPSPESLTPTERGSLTYSQDRIPEIFSREDSKRNVRLIYFLMYTNPWWLTITDGDFNKFLRMAEDNNLPACLTSQEEVAREKNSFLGRDEKLAQPARHTLTDLTFDQHKDMDTAFQELKSLYPKS